MVTMAEEYDCIVIGAGIMGLSTAWHLVHKERARVLVIEQWPIPNGRGSSVGHSRIFRGTYKEPIYCQMISEAVKLWREIERISKTKLLNSCGLLLGGSPNHLRNVEHTMIENKNECERIAYRDLKKRYPQLQNFEEDDEFIFDPNAGFIAAQEAMETLYRLVREHGAQVRTREKLTSLESTGSGSIVHTNLNTYRGKAVVLTMGPWIINFLRNQGIHLPMTSLKAAVCYFQAKSATDAFGPSKYPCVSRHFDPEDEGNLIYGIPEYEFPGCVKFGHHHSIEADPDLRDNVAYPKALIDQVIQYVSRHFPDLHSSPAIVDYCMYTMTPDNNYIIDRHPLLRNVIIGAGFSGHGFKMGPMVGRLLAEMALNKKMSLDCSEFRIDRFPVSSKL